MSCEYAQAGSTVVLKGAYFADDPNVPLTVEFRRRDAKIVPPTRTFRSGGAGGGAVEATVAVTSIYGRGESGFHYPRHARHDV